MATNHNNEIDLKELMKKIIIFIKNYKILWFIALILGIAAAFYGYKTTKPYYETQMIITSNLKTDVSQTKTETDLQPILSVLNIIKTEVQKHNKNFIANDLKITPPETIKNIDINVFKDKNLRVSPKNIQIKIQIYDTKVLPTIQDNIITYCNSNDYIKDQIKQQNTIQKQTFEIINKRMKFFNFIQDELETNIKKPNQLLLINFNDWQNILDLEIEKIELSHINGDTSAVSIVVPFSKYPTKISKKKQKAAVYFIIVIILAFVTASVLEINKMLKNE